MKQTRLKSIIVLLPIFITGGCAGMSGKFTSSEEVNLEPFATNTIQMVNSIDYALERDNSLLTRQYLLDEENKELKRLIALDDELYRILRSIVAYSVKIVNLSSSSKTEKEQVDAFAAYLENLDKPALKFHIEQGNVTQKDYLDILENIRKQEELLEAMQAAQPMIQFILDHVEFVAAEIKRQELKAARSIEKAIDKDYAKEIDFVNMLLGRRDIILSSLVKVDRHYQGDKKAIKKLNRGKIITRLGLKPRKITNANIKQLEKELVVALSEIQRQLDLLENDADLYVSAQKELDGLVKFHDTEVRKVKGFIQLWSQAHSKMASGITDPADWFDITDPSGELFDLAKTIIKR